MQIKHESNGFYIRTYIYAITLNTQILRPPSLGILLLKTEITKLGYLRTEIPYLGYLITENTKVQDYHG